MAANFLLHLVYGGWKDPKDSFPYSPQFRVFERLPELVAGVGSSILLAGVVALLAWWLVGVSRAGLYLRFVDANPRIAHAAGVPVQRTILGAVLLSGAMAGLAGFAVVASGRRSAHAGLLSGLRLLGHPHRLPRTQQPARGHGGCAAGGGAVRHRPQPAGVLPGAVLDGAAHPGGDRGCVASSDFFIRHRLRRVGGRVSGNAAASCSTGSRAPRTSRCPMRLRRWASSSANARACSRSAPKG